jgi:cell pole-organizing protein PopZ
MEEILASIRRIISEDDAPEDGAAAKAAPEPEPEAADVDFDAAPAAEEEPDEDVLELTETYEAPKSVSIGDIDAFEMEAEPEPAPAPKPIPKPKAAAVEGGLVSQRTEASAASAFGNLTGALLVPQSDRTLEDVTRDLLRPLLQAWLDENLPGIVEEQVRAEVERIARQSRR